MVVNETLAKKKGVTVQKQNVKTLGFDILVLLKRETFLSSCGFLLVFQ